VLSAGWGRLGRECGSLYQNMLIKMKIWRKCIGCGRYVLSTQLLGGFCVECTEKQLKNLEEERE